MTDPPTINVIGSTNQPKLRSEFFLNQSVSKIRRLNAKEVEKILKCYGFKLVPKQGKGSHRKWRNPETKRQAIVPFHGNNPIPVGTLRGIFKAAEIPESEWKD